MRSVILACSVATLAFATSSCSPSETSLPEVGLKGVAGPAFCPAATDPEYFFPPDALIPRGEYLHWTLRTRYEDFLRKMLEPSLYCGEQAGDSYRFAPILWLGSPATLRITRSSGGATMTFVTLEALAIYVPPGEIVQKRKRLLSERSWMQVENAVDRAGFWRLPTTADNADAIAGRQRTWILEGRKGRAYHVAARGWDTTSEGEFRSLGLEILAVAGISEAELESDAPGARVRRNVPPQPGVPEPPPPVTRGRKK